MGASSKFSPLIAPDLYWASPPLAVMPTILIDEAKCLRDRARCDARVALLDSDLLRPLTAFVEAVRVETGKDRVPYFDPLDGGVDAECLFLLEAPGRRAVESGFVSRNNPDGTAKNWRELNAAADIDRRRTVTWNIVPWYIGQKGKIREEKIRAANRDDIELSKPYLQRLLGLLPRVRVVGLVGRKAGQARSTIADWRPALVIVDLPHPSPVNLGTRPWQRDKILQELTRVRAVLDGRA